MSLRDDIESDLFDLLDDEMFGRDMLIDGDYITGIWQSDNLLEPGQTPGHFAGSIVERYRLIVSKKDLEAVTGQELDIDGVKWTVVGIRPWSTMTDLVVERYTA